MKRTPLTRRTPLRRTPIKPVSDKTRKRTASYTTVRKEVLERDQRRCALCASEGRWTPVSDTHHILYRSQGGLDTRGNLISLCRACHDRAHLTGSPRAWRPFLFALVAVAEARARLRTA